MKKKKKKAIKKVKKPNQSEAGKQFNDALKAVFYAGREVGSK